MEHLKIEQNNNLEIVTSSTIEKLKLLTKEGLDSSSNLAGNLQVQYAYQDSINYLMQKFPDLNISVSGAYYKRFSDDALTKIMATFGDGIGITESVYNNTQWYTNGSNDQHTIVGRLRSSNLVSDIKILDFHDRSDGAFAPLEAIARNALPYTSLEEAYFGDCGTVKFSIENLSSIADVGIPRTGQRNLIKKLLYKSVSNVSGNQSVKMDCDIAGIYLDNNVTEIGTYMFRGYLINKLYLPWATPPTLNMGYGDDINNATTIYVPVGSAQLYAQAENWSAHTGGYEEYDFETDPDGIFSVYHS